MLLLLAGDGDSQLLMQGKGLWEQEDRGHRSGRAAALKLTETHTAVRAEAHILGSGGCRGAQFPGG